MKNNFKEIFSRCYGIVAKGLTIICGLALIIHFALENEMVWNISKVLFCAGAIMLGLDLILYVLCRYVTLINKGKQQEEAEIKASEENQKKTYRELAEAKATLAERAEKKQREENALRIFKEIG